MMNSPLVRLPIPALIALAFALLALSACGEFDPGSEGAGSGFGALEGSWTRTHASGHYVYTFLSAEGGDSFTHESFEIGASTPINSSSGGASALDDHLALWTTCELTTGTPGSQELGPYAIHGQAFSRDQVYLPMDPDAGLHGIWLMNWERYVDTDCTGYPDAPHKTRTDTLEFHEDGTFRYTSNEMTTTPGGTVVPLGQAIDRWGTWLLEEDAGVETLYTQDDQQTAVYTLTESGAMADLNPSYWYIRD